MLRALRVRLNPETVSWAVGFSLLEFGVASCLGFFGVGGGLVMAWMLAAGGLFAVCEHGLFAWLWVMIVTHDEKEPGPEKSAPESTPAGPSSDTAESLGKNDSSSSSSAKPDSPNPQLVLEEKLELQIATRSSNPVRAAEVLGALALALFAYFGSHWTPARMPPPDQAALQHSIDQLHQELKDCKEAMCRSHSNSDDNTDGTGFGGDPSHFDPKFKQDILDAIKQIGKDSSPSWTNSSIFGISIIALLIIILGVALVLMFRKRPETAAPLGAVGLAATAIKEAEHLSRLDVGSYRLAEWAFLLLLAAFALLAFWKILKGNESSSATPKGDQKKSKVESPLSLLFSLLVLLWALLVICYRQQQTVPVQPPPPTISSDLSLPSVSGFVAGSSDKFLPKNTLDEFKQRLTKARAESIQPDDVLLLLGSADCTAVRRSLETTNNQIARNRATTVAGIVRDMKLLPDDHVFDGSLYQSDRCTQSADLRAVFPVLIKVKKANAPTQ
jgi:hypothetical protein